MKENMKPINPNWNSVLKAIGAKPKTIAAVPAANGPVADPPGPIATLPLSKLRPFRDHPYQVREDAELLALSDSIEQHGVLSPVLVRPLEGTNEYEIVSGHRRCRAAELAGLSSVPVIVTELSRDEAVIQMVDSNLHRDHLLPSEKAFAYRMKLEAMKRTAGRPKKENTPQPAANYRGDDAAVFSHLVPQKINRFLQINSAFRSCYDSPHSTGKCMQKNNNTKCAKMKDCITLAHDNPSRTRFPHLSHDYPSRTR